jgi:hypothetical protein
MSIKDMSERGLVIFVTILVKDGIVSPEIFLGNVGL